LRKTGHFYFALTAAVGLGRIGSQDRRLLIEKRTSGKIDPQAEWFLHLLTSSKSLE
jgi:hypothetical protein